jgi:glycosyltransferase involved in cell wall biosynthesis
MLSYPSPTELVGFDVPPRQDLTLSVVIPVYNERRTLPRIVRAVMLAVPHIRKEIIIVDDGSRDGTREWLTAAFPSAETFISGVRRSSVGEVEFLPAAKESRTVGEVEFLSAAKESCSATGQLEPLPKPAIVRRIFQEKNSGKGRALRTGFESATGEVIVIQDADLEYDPAEWTEMIRLMELGVADVVYGSRFYGRPHRSLFMYHMLGNKTITYLFNFLFDQTLTDIETCYKMFRRTTLDGVALVSNDFGIEVELSAVLAGSKKWRVYETGITYYGRTYVEGKKIGWRDGLKALWYVVKFRLRK